MPVCIICCFKIIQIGIYNSNRRPMELELLYLLAHCVPVMESGQQIIARHIFQCIHQFLVSCLEVQVTSHFFQHVPDIDSIFPVVIDYAKEAI